jgi:hypothetical protein
MFPKDLCPEMKIPVTERHIKYRPVIKLKKMSQELDKFLLSDRICNDEAQFWPNNHNRRICGEEYPRKLPKHHWNIHIFVAFVSIYVSLYGC